MGDYIIKGPWLEERVKKVLADLKRINKMLKKGERKDEKGRLVSQKKELTTERDLLKEVFKHATYNQKEEER